MLFFSLGGTNGICAASAASQSVSAGSLLCTLCSFLHEIFNAASLQLDQTGCIKCESFYLFHRIITFVIICKSSFM